uniref:cGMP-dependent protein kinase n=1 Tax=Polyblepharides amylifera TaxID=1486889 RepID=A0A7R9SVY1_9CHLO|mmetsp:Transcript_903/g.1294  ORF Transcript_903/g.1294 Transcript_903/m.1294 type:complete len:895 (+) Transcript_903:175-2859(+)|eukprot:CAMPEP_0196587978 /NCGR_PEP_ID=MMETSP1081-20130531/59197_1 /TAXON_ID=36882 /ORGANISM="Pyramimonas amylifera, Strain CCMP720" /LENGTH=894 /DNA_ID=CAMNT_0041910333 /DNA_START=162 /DNA_END=2846 /DNA_ORIENTATION=+
MESDPSFKQKRDRRAAVASGGDDGDSSETYVVTVHKKDAADVELIKKSLETKALFRNFEEKLFEDIVNALEPHEVAVGTEVIKQGDPGDYFYVVKSGDFEVSKMLINLDKDKESGGKASLNRQVTAKNLSSGVLPPGAESTILGNLSAPAAFGELALMYSSPRAATVKALKAGEVWRVEREVFRGILYRSQTSTMLRFLRQVPVLSRLSENDVTQFSGSFKTLDVKQGGEVSPDHFYIVQEGKLKVDYPGCKSAVEKPVLAGVKGGFEDSTLEKFSCFGERELLTNERGVKYTAIGTGAKLLCMEKAEFDAHMDKLAPHLNDQLKFQTLRSIELMKEVKSDQLMSVLDRFKDVVLQNGEQIIKQGTTGTKFCIIAKGTCDVLIDRNKVASLRSHNFFGERSLLNDDKTAAEVVASGEVHVMMLERDDFNTMLGPLKEIISRGHKIEIIKKVKLLQLLSDREVERLANTCTLVPYIDGDTIIKQGEVGETFYMIKSGEVIVLKDGKELARLSGGAFFGERALLEDEPRNSTIVASGEVECYAIDRDDFTKHLGPLSDIMQMHASKLERAKTEQQIQLHELKTLGMLGSGAFGLVSLVKDNKYTKRIFALKAINKKYVQEMKMQSSLRREVTVLGMVDHPMLMRIVKTFRDDRRVFMLMDPLMGGELFVHLGNAERFPESQAKFYAACVLLGLNHLHAKGIIYRDLKLENLLLDTKGYLKIVDFGFAKKLATDELAYTLCGTPDYLAPEIIKGTGHDKGCDLWSLGILIFEMLHGYTPFSADDDSQIFTGILSGEIEYEDHISDCAQSIIRALLNRNPKTRIGNGKFGIKPILSHPWFKGMDWTKLEKEQLPAPFIPELQAEDDCSNFDEVDEAMHEEHCVPCEDKMLDSIFGDSF